MGKMADGSQLMMHWIPAKGKLSNFMFTEKLPYMLLVDDNGQHVYNTETGEYITDIRLGNKRLVQFGHDGYLACTDNWVLQFRSGAPTFYKMGGQKVWESKLMVVMANARNNVVVCVKRSKPSLYTAFDMTTGCQLWQQTLYGKASHPFLHVFSDPSDSTNYYLLGDSIYRLNILTGQKLSHPFTAGMTDKLWSKPQLVRRVKASNWDFAHEMYCSLFTRGLVLAGIHSNPIFSGDSIFVADADSVYCFDKSLTPLWQTAIPDGMGAKSEIRLSGSRLLLINLGVAFQNGLTGRMGTPFTATYDRATGRQLSLDRPDITKKIYGGTFTGGRAWWQTLGGFYYSDEGDTVIHKVSWKPQTNYQPDDNHPDFCIQDTVWVVGPSGAFTPLATGSNQLVVEVYGKDVNVVRPDGTCRLLSADSVYFRCLHNVYSTNGGCDCSLRTLEVTSPLTHNVYSTNGGPDRVNNFVVLNPRTKQIECTLRLKGTVARNHQGDLMAFSDQGAWFRKRQQHSTQIGH